MTDDLKRTLERLSKAVPAGFERVPRLTELDPSNWEHQQIALALCVQRNGPLCRHGHPWFRHGLLQADHRVRCMKCMAARVKRWRHQKASGVKRG